MRLVLYFSSKFACRPTTLDGFEAFARKYLLKDIYGYYSSGSIMGLQQTVQENTAAFSRSLSIQCTYDYDIIDIYSPKPHPSFRYLFDTNMKVWYEKSCVWVRDVGALQEGGVRQSNWIACGLWGLITTDCKAGAMIPHFLLTKSSYFCDVFCHNYVKMQFSCHSWFLTTSPYTLMNNTGLAQWQGQTFPEQVICRAIIASVAHSGLMEILLDLRATLVTTNPITPCMPVYFTAKH